MIANEHYNKLILASSSTIRMQLLQEAGIKFTAISSPFDEESAKPAISHLPHKERALYLASGKAAAISKLYPDSHVIGADQICADEKRTYSKPVTKEQAALHLQYLQGNVHFQHSAACLFHSGKKIWESCEIVTLQMRPLNEHEITSYIETDSPLQACGAYCYEKNGRQLFRKVEGSESAIKGLPMDALIKALQQFCPELL
jgi:septum formation protein